MTVRRQFIAGASLAACLAPLTALAQRAQKMPRIALLSNNTRIVDLSGPDPIDPNARAFVHGLRDLGWVEGRNIAIERRSADGHPERIPALVQDVVALGVDVLVAYGPAMSLAAKSATETIPVVMIAVANPVGIGLVSSLARPGGNITGLSMDAGAALNGKRLELLKRIAPAATRVAVIRDRPRAGRPTWSPETDAAARALGLTLSMAAVDAPEDFDAAFAAITRERADALWCPDSPVNIGNRNRIIDFAARQRLPAVYAARLFVDAGGLMSYGAELADLSRRAASYVDRLLKGAKPADLPIEQPTRFYLVINLKTAKALGLTIPYALRVFADEVIE
jgi:putative tryptophan/tyrosine transport system substrate-binding protein